MTKLDAIKLLKEKFGLSLQEAKDLQEVLTDGWTSPQELAGRLQSERRALVSATEQIEQYEVERGHLRERIAHLEGKIEGMQETAQLLAGTRLDGVPA